MEITVKCTCDNKVVISAFDGKCILIRDWLRNEQFRLDKENNKEFIIRCDKCGKWIKVNVD